MQSFIGYSKRLVEEDNLDELQIWYEQHKDETFAWEYIFQKIYLHACLKKKKEIVEWLQTLFSSFDPIQQIGIRQMFSYGRYLMSKS
jgi:hypothetical protein